MNIQGLIINVFILSLLSDFITIRTDGRPHICSNCDKVRKQGENKYINY